MNNTVQSFLNGICCVQAPTYNTIIGQPSLGALGITDAASLSQRLIGTTPSDISYFNIDPVTFDIQAMVNKDWATAQINIEGTFFSSNITKLIDNDGRCKSLGDYSFGGCQFLQRVKLPGATVAEFVGFGYTFGGCTALTSVELDSLTNLPILAFESCTSLTSISLPVATTIEGGAFLNCTSLTSISIPSVTTLGGSSGDDLVFYGITGKNITLTIPAALNNDGDVQYLQANNTVTIINSPLL